MLTRGILNTLSALCLVAAAWFALCFLYIATVSLFYPFPLEWMEGHTLDIMQRLLDGKPFYTKPSLEYVPYIYTPYYFYLSAFVSLFTGVDFLAARLVSVLATLGTGGILYAWVRKEGGGFVAGLIAAGLYFATYQASGRWFDVARVDSLYVFLMIAGLYVYQFGHRRWDTVLAAALFAAAFFTKQSAILALAPALLAALWIDRKRALQTALVAGLLMAGGCLWLQLSSDGWFSFYVYDVPAGHVNDYRQVSLFWTRDLLPQSTIMMTLSLLLLLHWWQTDKKKLLWYSSILFGLVGSAYLSRIHSYGHVNVLMPAFCVFSLFSGIALVRPMRQKPTLAAAMLLALAVQFYALLYPPNRYTPNPAAEKNGWEFIDRLRHMKGEILLSELQFIQTKAGKKSYSIGMAGFDILRSDLGEKNSIKDDYRRSILVALKNKQFSHVITGQFIRLRELEKHYHTLETINKPQEFITGGVYFNKGTIYVPLSSPD